MTPCIVVAHRRDWPHETPGARVLTAREWLDDPRAAEGCGEIVNLCKTYRYQSRGYYVSLLAEARGHRPLPDVRTIEDLHQARLLRLLTEGLDDALQRALADDAARAVRFDVFFGASDDGRRDPLAEMLFETLRLPLMRVLVERDAAADEPDAGGPAARVGQDGQGGQAWRPGQDAALAPPGAPRRRRRWRLAEVEALGPGQVRLEDRPRMARAAADWIAGRQPDRAAARLGSQPRHRPAVAILHDPDADDAPSNPRALERFQAAAETLGMRSALLTGEHIERLPEFDALFIRATTHVAHHTYRFARRAAALGLAVIDDPDSILRCTNKVYLHELLSRHGVPVPRTLLVHAGNAAGVPAQLGLPCILKRPDGAFSLGVKKVGDAAELERVLAEFLRDSDLVVAQEWLPTAFDWRVGVLEGRALFACKYFMAPGHWQVIRREPRRDLRVEGRTAAIPLAEAPAAVVDAAVRAARLVGDGFYGVDLKEADGRVVVIEVNDNPNVDAGNEDAALGDALYLELMRALLRRVPRR